MLQNWIRKAAKAVKTIDNRHLLTVGEEGFYTSPENNINPGLWASDTGQDFVLDHSFTDIDYASSHLWIDNWNLFSPWIQRRKNGSFSKQWIEEHSKDSLSILNKPFMLSEYGTTGFGSRNNIFRSLVISEERRQIKVCQFYNDVHSSLLKNKNGALFWIWHHENMKTLPSYRDEYGVFSSDDVFVNLKNFSNILQS